MSENKELGNAPINWHIINWVSIIGMIATSLYLTNHYFEVHFPTGLTGGSLCDINSFFTCSAATHSHLSNLFGVPISLFGLLIGVFIGDCEGESFFGFSVFQNLAGDAW